MAKTKKSAARNQTESSGEQQAEEALSFEGALERLEETVGRLEEGEMPLEEALALFEQGVKLSRQCTTTLEAAEKRVEILVAGRGDDWLVAPFAEAVDSGLEPVEEDDELD